MEYPICFGVRHLSPAGAWYLRQLLEERQPKLILVEGPSDFNDLMGDITRPETKPPFAVMAFTKESPIRSILYPFAEYSPEYQAILWAKEHEVACRFMDLPAGVFLGISNDTGDGEDAGEVYRLLDKQCHEDSHETFWEHVIEHCSKPEDYMAGANTFGKELRSLTEGSGGDWPEILVREAYMRRQIEKAVKEGYERSEIVIVTGAYHVAGILGGEPPMTEAEEKTLPAVECNVTLMPYSYYRLSSRSGYGAGNKAPAYYALLWQSFCEDSREMTAYHYLSKISTYQREHGFMVSSAEVIEAVELAKSLAALHGYQLPSLSDLRDAAVTCMGHGSFSEIALAVADTEIGAVIGALPQGVSRTSLQDDFYRSLKELRLEKYKTDVTAELSLDLREKLSVKSEEAAFRDLNRSFFLHRLRVLGVSFAKLQKVKQEEATWAELWSVRWTPEAEIELVESALKGDTIAQAASFVIREEVQAANGAGEAARILEAAFFCGMSEAVSYITEVLQKMAVDSSALSELAAAAERLSVMIRFGSIRRLDSSPLLPVLEQIFLRACLLLANACVCDDQAAEKVMASIEQLNQVCICHDFLDQERWIDLLGEISSRDDLNTRISGFAAAILLERGRMKDEELSREVSRRLSKGIPAELGAGWFAGLSRKNRYALIARLSLWQELSDYLDTLDDEEFKRALLFLRRAFADFSSREKNDVAENLGEIWHVSKEQASEVLNGPLQSNEMEMLDSLGDFDFDDI